MYEFHSVPTVSVRVSPSLCVHGASRGWSLPIGENSCDRRIYTLLTNRTVPIFMVEDGRCQTPESLHQLCQNPIDHWNHWCQNLMGIYMRRVFGGFFAWLHAIIGGILTEDNQMMRFWHSLHHRLHEASWYSRSSTCSLFHHAPRTWHNLIKLTCKWQVFTDATWVPVTDATWVPVSPMGVAVSNTGDVATVETVFLVNSTLGYAICHCELRLRMHQVFPNTTLHVWHTYIKLGEIS